jgi:ClpP class serine protease
MRAHPHILSEIVRTPWAIAPSALQAITRAAEGCIEAADYSTFHGAGADEQISISAQLGTKVQGSRMSFIKDGVGSLQINGPIIPRADAFTDVSGLASIDRLTSEFRQLEADPDVKTILLVMDSPGGAVTGVSEFAAMVRASSKPVAVYVYGMAASAAYWIASAAQEIIVADTGIVGSIGVVVSVRKARNEEIEIVSSQSPNKRPDVETDEGKDEIRKLVNGLADVFISTVAKNRGVSTEKVLSDFGRGGMVLPTAAISAGMADGVATLSEYFEAVASGRLSGEEAENGTAKVNNLTVRASALDNRSKSIEKVHPEEKMNLTEFLKEHPEAVAEIDAIKAKALAEGEARGVAAGRAAASNETTARNAQATKILASDTYPARIKAAAVSVIEGKKAPDYLEMMVDVYDSMKASEEIKGAQADSAEAPATPPQNVTPLSTDGVLRTPADIDAAAAAMKAGR